MNIISDKVIASFYRRKSRPRDNLPFLNAWPFFTQGPFPVSHPRFGLSPPRRSPEYPFPPATPGSRAEGLPPSVYLGGALSFVDAFFQCVH